LLRFARNDDQGVMPGGSRSKNGVAALAYVADIPDFRLSTPKTWMAGTSPAMTR
jgi:hypothetical protein